MQHPKPKRPAVSKHQFVSFGISLFTSNTVAVYTLPPVKGSNLTALEPPTWGLHAKWSPLIPEPSRVADAMADIRIGTSAFIWVKVGPAHSIRGECSRAIPCLTMRLNLRRDNQ